jgi:hypothetical protein
VIHEIGVELQAKLQANGTPLPVVDGPEPTTTTTWGRERIVIEYDTSGSDTFGDPHGHSTNPKKRFSATEACKATIYARSQETGASVFEHRRRAKKVRDDVLVALELVARQDRNRFRAVAGRFLAPPDLEKSERPGGAVYELRFTYERPIVAATFAGAKKPEATLGLFMQGTPLLTFAFAGRTITRSSGSWIDDGFAPGMTVTIKGSEDNDIRATVAAVAATVLTLLSPAELIDEGPTAGVTVYAGGFRSTTNASLTGADLNPEMSCGD